MIKKKHLIDKLYEALELEEEASTHFHGYTVNSLKYYTWLSDDKREKIKEIITKLGADSQRHKTIVEKLIERVEESKKNVF